MSDPMPAPDDDIAATRARIATQCEAALNQVRLMEEERDAALFRLDQITEECYRLKTQRVRWEELLHAVPGGAEGPADIARWINVARWINNLLIVAEAFKELARAEDYEPGNECSEDLERVMAAVLALGPEWDWRTK